MTINKVADNNKNKIFYTEYNYPVFFNHGLPPTVAWLEYPYSKINIIYDCEGVYNLLINSGMSHMEAAMFFDYDDPRGCIELKEED